MKRNIILLLAVLWMGVLHAQVNMDKARQKFKVGIDLYSDLWQDVPDDLDVKTINRGAGVFWVYNSPFGTSNFSFSVGAGISSHNIYGDAYPDLSRVNDSSFFVPLNDSVDYKKSKITTSFLDIPFEIIFTSKNDYRVAVGFKAGFLLNSHSKYKGDDLSGVSDDLVVIKKSRLTNIERKKYGFTLRLGYRWFNLYGYYPLSNLFEKDGGPEMYSYTVGITIMPF
jgi:hypothetical protein